MTENKLFNARKKVADIYKRVFTGNLSVKNALLLFPSGISDDTLDCAWHALCHLEADEDLRAKDPFYMQEQDKYILFLHSLLAEGKAFPNEIIISYKKYYKKSSRPRSKGFRGFLNSILTFLNFYD